MNGSRRLRPNASWRQERVRPSGFGAGLRSNRVEAQRRRPSFAWSPAPRHGREASACAVAAAAGWATAPPMRVNSEGENPSSVSTALLNLPERCTKRSVHSRPGIQREKPTRTRPPLQRTSDDRKAKTGKGTSVENDSWESVEIASVVAEANRKGHALVTVKGRVGCKGLRPQAMPFLLRRGLLVLSRKYCNRGRAGPDADVGGL